MTKALKSGIDVAHYQSEPRPIDFAKMAAAMTADQITNMFAFKATQGSNFVDGKFKAHRAGASVLPCDYRLMYHFLNWKPGTAWGDAVAQAKWYLKAVGTLAVGEGALLDAEVFAVPGMTAAQVAGYYAEEARFSDVWADYVEQVTGRPIMLYSVKQMWRTAALNNGKRGLCMAWWPGSSVTDDANADDQARAKALPVAGSTPLASWQWSDRGSYPGIAEVVDIDMILDHSFHRAACGLTGSPVPIPTVPTLHGHLTVRLGDRGRDVTVLQHELNMLDYLTDEDGIFDRELEDKVRFYQDTHGLTVDGVCGVKETWPSLLERKPVTK